MYKSILLCKIMNTHIVSIRKLGVILFLTRVQKSMDNTTFSWTKLQNGFFGAIFLNSEPFFKSKKMASKWQKMASNMPSDLRVPFSQVDALQKMAPCFCGFTCENDSRSHFFDQKRVKLLAILHV